MWEEKNEIKYMPFHLCAKHSSNTGYAKKDGLGTKNPNLCHAIYVQNIVVVLDMRKRMVLRPKNQIYAMPSTGKTVEVLDMRKRKVLALKKPLLS